MRVLLVEDDSLLAEGIVVALEMAGYVVDHLENGEHALHALDSESFDVLVLDLGLPGISGFDVLQNLRKRDKALPVLILTARDQVAEKVKGLDLGADDYLLKPFDVDELKARLRALMRRPGGQRDPVLQIKDLRIDPALHQVYRGEHLLSLSPKEYAILHALSIRPDRVLSKARLAELVYGWSDETESNSIEVHVHNLRKKVGADLISTVRGVGYCIRQ